MRGQAALQAVYNPDRLKTPLLKEKEGFVPIGFGRAQALLKTKVWEAARRGPERVRLMSEVIGECQMEIFRTALENWNSPPPVVFEPFAYEALKAANREVFGVDGLVSYRLDQADLLLAFGAEFLETWLSPVEYAWKFKAMHAARGPEKGLFFLVSPFQTLTGANADRWLACAPGTEAVVALGLVRQMLDIRRGQHLPPDLRGTLLKATEAYQQEAVLRLSGIPLSQYEQLVVRLTEARRPLVLGAGSGQSDANGLAANLAANLLNLLLDPELLLIDAAGRHRVEIASRRADVLDLIKAVSSGGTDVLILNNVNPVFSLPPEISSTKPPSGRTSSCRRACRWKPGTITAGGLRSSRPSSRPWAGSRRHRTSGTFSWTSVLKPGRRRITRPTSPSGFGRQAVSATSSSGCKHCSRAAFSRRPGR
jgi:molybdopterin-containing oxidoreductase family iron-sulfur binding subunit